MTRICLNLTWTARTFFARLRHERIPTRVQAKQAISSPFDASGRALYSRRGSNPNLAFFLNVPRSTFDGYVESANGDDLAEGHRFWVQIRIRFVRIEIAVVKET